jgi:orotidine-5'-phosphate decarboxylase
MWPPSKIIVALDYDNETECLAMVSQLHPAQCRLKIAITLFTKYGPPLIKSLHQLGFDVFLDLKFHDIPQQVAGACLAAAEMGVWMVNVHALGGLTMLKSARAAVDSLPNKKPLLIGVTVLTSLDLNDLHILGVSGSPTEAVLRLATLCREANLDGVVCSAEEAPLIKSTLGNDFLCVTPGIRLADGNKHDQKRVVTPIQAILGGSDYLVMGRTITEAPSPALMLNQINQSICTI